MTTTNATTASTTTPAWMVTSRQREPPSFSGLPGDDVQNWIENYHLVSTFNQWDDSLKLLNVSWSLNEVAKTWFYNNREQFTDWERFTTELRRIFGRACTRSEAAKRKLEDRIQQPGESYTSYIEDVLALCRRANKDMTEEDLVRQILKGISLFAFNALAVQNPTSVREVIATCQRLEELQSLRVQPTTVDTKSYPDADLRALIRSIIREELSGQPSLHYAGGQQSPVPGLRGMVREELASVTCDRSPTRDIAPEPPHADPSRPPPSAPAVPLAPPLQQTYHPHLAPLSPVAAPPVYYSAWRQPRPTCYYCGIRGHISRFCRKRQQDERRAYLEFSRGDRRQFYDPYHQSFPYSPRRFFSPPPDSSDHQSNSPPFRRRSPSPRRRSTSPLRPASRLPEHHPEN